MKTTLLRLLARYPRLYLRFLKWTGRGSLEKRIFLALVYDGDVVFDIGANRGHFTRLFSDLVGPRGWVHAFEPVPSTFEVLRRTMQNTGGLSNFALNRFAFGDSEGEATLHLPGDDDGQASMRTHEAGSWRSPAGVQRYECRVTTLDLYAANSERLDFLKCDVEGAELPVMKGGASTLERLSPMLFLEVNPDWTKSFGYKPEDLVDWLRLRGYDTFFIAAEKLGSLENQKFQGSANLLCAKSKLHAARLGMLDRL